MFKSIVQHLRFPFSILLMPIFLFALDEMKQGEVSIKHAILLFFILHVLVYPSSNAYNSIQDNDKGSIGLIENPLPVVKQLEGVTVIFDISAVLLALLINTITALGILIYILFSRLYSYRKIRLKKNPITGFLTVFIFQGAWIFILVTYATSSNTFEVSWQAALCASCLIGAIYPLSQIYQHKQDEEDGVISISALLGYKGTFVFSAILFSIGTTLYCWTHYLQNSYLDIILFMTCQLPLILFFLYWFYQVIRNNDAANFKNAMRMNILSAVCMNSCFIMLYFFR